MIAIPLRQIFSLFSENKNPRFWKARTYTFL